MPQTQLDVNGQNRKKTAKHLTTPAEFGIFPRLPKGRKAGFLKGR